MITKQYTLASGRVVTLGMPDLYKLAATDVDIPNQALTDIMDLITYGAMVSGTGTDDKRREENRRFVRSQFELAALCALDPPLILRGDVPDGALTPDDFTPRDLRGISEFFQTGGRERVPATTDNEPGGGTQVDLSSETVEQDAE
jgi:hypothetical protein